MDRTNQLTVDEDKDPSKLISAVQHGDVPLVKSLLEAKCNPSTLSDTLGFPATPLIVSAAVGHNEIAKLLLEAGASVQDAPHVGATALHAACGQGGNGEMVELLLSFGAEVPRAARPKAHAARCAASPCPLLPRLPRGAAALGHPRASGSPTERLIAAAAAAAAGRLPRRHRVHAALLLVPGGEGGLREDAAGGAGGRRHRRERRLHAALCRLPRGQLRVRQLAAVVGGDGRPPVVGRRVTVAHRLAEWCAFRDPRARVGEERILVAQVAAQWRACGVRGGRRAAPHTHVPARARLLQASSNAWRRCLRRGPT